MEIKKIYVELCLKCEEKEQSIRDVEKFDSGYKPVIYAVGKQEFKFISKEQFEQKINDTWKKSQPSQLC